MVKTNTPSKKLPSYSGEDDELPFEFHITGTIKPGDDDGHPRYRITDVIVSPTDDLEEEQEDLEEEDEPVVRINKLRKEIKDTVNRRLVKKKLREEPDDDEDSEDSDEDGSYDSENLTDEDWETSDDGGETIMSCIQKSVMRRR